VKASTIYEGPDASGVCVAEKACTALGGVGCSRNVAKLRVSTCRANYENVVEEF